MTRNNAINTVLLLSLNFLNIFFIFLTKVIVVLPFRVQAAVG